MTTTKRQLDELKLGHLFPAVIEETERVRAELGYPIMVTPFPQMVMSQALFNVIGDGALRPGLGPGAALRARQVRPADQRRSIRRSRRRSSTGRGRARSRPSRASRRLPTCASASASSMDEEEFLLRAVMPADQVDAMLAAGPSRRDLHARSRADPEAAQGAGGAAGGARPRRRAAGLPACAACRARRRVSVEAADRRGAGLHPRHGRHDRARRPGERRPCRAAGRGRAAGADKRRRGVPFRIFTNGTAKPPAVYAASLRAAGFDVADEEMMTPSTSAAAWLTAQRIGRVRVLGNKGTAAPLVEAGIEVIGPSDAAEGVEAVYTGWHRDSPSPIWRRRCTTSGPGRGRSPRATSPSSRPATARGIGTSFAMNSMIRALTGKRPKVLGKPSRDGFFAALAGMGLREERGAGDRRGRRRSGAGDADGEPGRGDVGRRRDRAQLTLDDAEGAAGAGPAACWRWRRGGIDGVARRILLVLERIQGAISTLHWWVRCLSPSNTSAPRRARSCR